jgi:hypothetical protein
MVEVYRPIGQFVLWALSSSQLVGRLEEQEALSERSQPYPAWWNVLSGLCGLSGVETRDQVRPEAPRLSHRALAPGR